MLAAEFPWALFTQFGRRREATRTDSDGYDVLSGHSMPARFGYVSRGMLGETFWAGLFLKAGEKPTEAQEVGEYLWWETAEWKEHRQNMKATKNLDGISLNYWCWQKIPQCT